MRISYWSSDVCSSDLLFQATTDPWPRIALASVVDQHLDLHATRLGLRQRGDKLLADCVVVEDVSAKPDRLACGGASRQHRSAERRVGTECVNTGRSRWWQYP